MFLLIQSCLVLLLIGKKVKLVNLCFVVTTLFLKNQIYLILTNFLLKPNIILYKFYLFYFLKKITLFITKKKININLFFNKIILIHLIIFFAVLYKISFIKNCMYLTNIKTLIFIILFNIIGIY